MEDRLSEPVEGSSKIKVVDRRRFDESGDLRPDMPKPEPKAKPVPEESPAAATPPPEAPAPDPPADRPPSPEAPAGQSEPQSASQSSPLFLDLIAGLAQQAEMLMNGAEGLPAQPAEAQRVIEYLAMLEDKTTGNLSGEEKQILTNVIFQLRSMFVQQNR